MSNWRKDLERYGGVRCFLREQSIYSVALYRLGKNIEALKIKPLKWLLKPFYYLLYRLFETLLSTSIPVGTSIGGGLRIWHFGQIFINNEVVIGTNCTLRQGVTIGSKVEGEGAPVLGDNVDIGANSMIIGNVRIGSNVTIGAMTLVTKDVPDNCIALGIPARIKQK